MYTFTLILAVAVSSIGSGFQHGYNIGVLNNPEKEIKGWVSEETDTTGSSLWLYWGAIVSLNPFGGLIGGAFTSIVCNYLGRKGGLLLNCLIAVAGGVLMVLQRTICGLPLQVQEHLVPEDESTIKGSQQTLNDISGEEQETGIYTPVDAENSTSPGGFAKSLGMVFLLILGRLLIGINSGLNAGLAPVYICEISPTKTRGALGSLYQLNITLSIFFAGLLGFESVMGSANLWPLLVALVAPVGLLQGIALFFCPESPRHYLEKKDDSEKAEKVCQKLFGSEYQEQYTELKNDIADAKKLPSIRVIDMFKEKKLRRPLILICVLMTAQQLSGINAVMFYSTEIFKMANFSQRSAQLSTIGIGVINVLTTVVSVWLVEASGRKPLLLVAFAGMVLSMALLFVSLYFVEKSDFMGYLSIAEVYLYVIFFAIGAGSIPWLLGPELFNTAARPLAVSFAVPVNWGWAFVVGLLFPSLQGLMGPAVFLIFIACNAGAFFFVWIFCPETKNKSIDVITAYFE